MKKDSISGYKYATQKARVSFSNGKKVILVSDKLDQEEFVKDIYAYAESERRAHRLDGTITGIKFLSSSVIELGQ